MTGYIDLPEFASKKEACLTELADFDDTLLRLGHVSDNGTSEIQGTTLIKWNARGDALPTRFVTSNEKNVMGAKRTDWSVARILYTSREKEGGLAC